MRRALPLALVILAASAASLAAQPPGTPTVTIAVVAAMPPVSPEGFVDGLPNKDLTDSAADIIKAIDNRWWTPKPGSPGGPVLFRVVQDPAVADLTLTVGARGINSASLGQRTTVEAYRGAVLVDTVPMIGVTRWVSAVLAVGTYRKEFMTWSTNRSSFSAGAWTADARQLTEYVAAWSVANQSQIMQRQRDRLNSTGVAVTR